jgi:hypothetical protein
LLPTVNVLLSVAAIACSAGVVESNVKTANEIAGKFRLERIFIYHLPIWSGESALWVANN